MVEQQGFAGLAGELPRLYQFFQATACLLVELGQWAIERIALLEYPGSQSRSFNQFGTFGRKFDSEHA